MQTVKGGQDEGFLTLPEKTRRAQYIMSILDIQLYNVKSVKGAVNYQGKA